MRVELEKIRESLVVGLIGVVVLFTVCVLMGFAWTFKSAVEAPQKIRHALSRSA
jgi:hypothetical protein